MKNIFSSSRANLINSTKVKYPLLLSFFLLLIAGCKTNTISQTEVNKQLQALLDQKDFFKLQARVKLYGPGLNDKNRLYYNAFLNNAFNRNDACIGEVDSLLKIYEEDFPDSLKSTLSRLQSDSYFKTYQYAKAAQTDSILLQRYSKVLRKEVIDDIKNDLLMRSALKNVPLQKTVISKTTTIPWVNDKLGLIEIPFKCKAQTFDGVFDTRANISSITKTYAKKLGLRLLNVSYNESSGVTGIQFKTGIGIADSLYIGDILVKNVVFQVMPDSILYIAPLKFQLSVIIGYPVIEQMKEVDVYKDGKMTIPKEPAQTDLHNFALNGLDPVIALKVGKDTLAFNFDSGASSSDFSAAYFEKNKAFVKKNGIKKTEGMGGAGGVQKVEVYILPAVSFTLGNRTVSVDSVSVLTKKMVPNEKLYGNIGQDFTKKFSKLIYNFKYMYIKGL
jgi:predicted aspartyl protease